MMEIGLFTGAPGIEARAKQEEDARKMEIRRRGKTKLGLVSILCFEIGGCLRPRRRHVWDV